MIKYIVDRIEEKLVVLVDMDTYKITIKKMNELPKVIPGDTVYYIEEEKRYIVDIYDRAQRLKNIRAMYNRIWDEEK